MNRLEENYVEGLHDFDIGREGRSWSIEEKKRKWQPHEAVPHNWELWNGKLFQSEAQRITVLGWMLEQLGTDVAVRLGDPAVWQEAVQALDTEKGL